MQVVISPSSSVIRRNDVRETLTGTSSFRYYYRNSQLRACDYIHSMKTRLLLNQNDQLLGFLLSKIIDLSAKKDSLVRFSISLIKIRTSNGYESKLNLKENSIRPYHSINWMILFQTNWFEEKRLKFFWSIRIQGELERQTICMSLDIFFSYSINICKPNIWWQSIGLSIESVKLYQPNL